MLNIYEFPMNLLTTEAGQNRKLVVKPVDVTPRVNIRPDDKGVLRVVDVDKIKISNTTIYPEVKEQGHFHFYSRDAVGSYGMYSKRQSVDGSYPNIIEKLADTRLPGIPKETVVAIELIYPDHPDCMVPTAIKECPDKLEVRGLGVPIYKGKVHLGRTSLSYTLGRRILSTIFPPELIVQNLRPIELKDKFHTAEVIKDLLEEARRDRIEGYVLKEMAYDKWWKLKGIREADVFITGFKVSESDTQYGLVTAVSIGVYDNNGEVVDVGSVTGFNMEDKKAMTAEYDRHPELSKNNYVGRVIRVMYQEIAGKGKLKHGFFDAWRDDKSKPDCSINQF